MNDDLISAVQSCVDKGVPARCTPFEWDGKRYWIKTMLRRQNSNWHRLQDVFSWLSRSEILRSTVSSPGQSGLDAEVSRLKKVAQRGILVPDVVAQRPGWILLSDIGPSLFEQLLATPDKEALLMKAIKNLAMLHQKGGWHGTGQLRDMVFGNQGTIGFIDFEEAVGEVMSVEAAQARDVLRFLVSSVRFDQENGDLLKRLLATYCENTPKTILGRIKSVMRLVAPLNFVLSPFYKKLGRDLRETLLVYKTLKPVIR